MNREELVTSGHLIFTRESQKADLLDPNITQDCLISLLSDIIAGGFHIGVTAVKTDHSNDSALGVHCHWNGFGMDGWPTTGRNLMWLAVDDPYFVKFLKTAAGSKYLWQTGLAGTAQTPQLQTAAGPTMFLDAGADHIHLGAKNPDE